MIPYRIQNADDFMDALTELSQQLDVIPLDQAATRVDHLNGVARRIAKRCRVDELEEAVAAAETMRGQVRRKWRRQRGRNIYTLPASALLSAFAAWFMRPAVSASVPSWLPILLFAIGAFVGVLGGSALNESTDWRDEVGKPLESIVSAFSAELAEREGKEHPYRDQARAESTMVRASPNVEPELEERDPNDDPEKNRRKR